MEKTHKYSSVSKTADKNSRPFFSFQRCGTGLPFFQPKLTGNGSEDALEKEADALAVQIVSDSEPPVINTGDEPSDISLNSQKSHYELDNPEAKENTRALRKIHDAGNDTIVNQSAGNDLSDKNSFEKVVKSKGSSLPPDTLDFMEQRMGFDFKNVQIHNDHEANKSSTDLNAHAYTYGNHIVFATGQYQPDTTQGKQLIAHELTHVMQQSVGRANGGLIQRKSKAKQSGVKQEATKLKAADAQILISVALPFIAKTLNSRQLEQLQKVFDALVVNPVVKAEAEDIRTKATKVYGQLVVRDETMIAQADRVMKNFTAITEADYRIRLDASQLLTIDAFQPTTDNPDEEAFLETMKQHLDKQGIWLRFYPKSVRDPRQPSQIIDDPRNFEFWLSLGANGDQIPSANGEVGRKELLGNTYFGSTYYDLVVKGKVNATLEKQIERLRDVIDMGFEQYRELQKIRDDAPWGVTELTDLVGGATFPDKSMLTTANKLLMDAWDFKLNGSVVKTQTLLVASSVVIQHAMRALSDYVTDMSGGTENVVDALEVLKTAGEVAEVGLAITTVAGLLKGGARATAAGVAEGESVNSAASSFLKDYLKKNPNVTEEELKSVVTAKLPATGKSVSGSVKAGHSAGGGTGSHKWP